MAEVRCVSCEHFLMVVLVYINRRMFVLIECFCFECIGWSRVLACLDIFEHSDEGGQQVVLQPVC